MIAETPSGEWLARHIPTGRSGRFQSELAAKCWLMVLDDRHGTRGWVISCVVRLISVWLFFSACVPAFAQPATNYTTEVRKCGVQIATVWMAKPNSQRYAMSFVVNDPARVQAEAQAFVDQYLTPKFNDPTAPPVGGDQTIYSNRLNWLILGRSPLGKGCG